MSIRTRVVATVRPRAVASRKLALLLSPSMYRASTAAKTPAAARAAMAYRGMAACRLRRKSRPNSSASSRAAPSQRPPDHQRVVAQAKNCAIEVFPARRRHPVGSTAAFRRNLQMIVCATSKVNALDAIVFAIEDVNAAVAVHRQGPRGTQFAGRATDAAPATQRLPLRGEFLHAMVAVLHDI